MDRAAIDFFQLLVQVGAVPGEDFSCDLERRVYRLSEHCYTLLCEAYPDVDWQDVIGEAQETHSNDRETLHAQLGYPFVDTLVAQMVSRLTTLPTEKAIGYTQVLLTGVESATGVLVYPWLVEQLDLSGQIRLEWLLRQIPQALPIKECLSDLAAAIGIPQDSYDVQGAEVWMTEAAWQQLALVWDGDCGLSPTAPRPLL